MLRHNTIPAANPGKLASSVSSLLGLCALELLPLLSGCSNGLVLSELDRPDGLAPILADGCEEAEDGSYILNYSANMGGNPEAMASDLALIRQAGGSAVSYAPELPMAVAQLPLGLLAQLRQNPELASVSNNCKYRKQSAGLARVPWGLDRIDQRQLPGDYVYQMAGTGRRVSVYVVDTGIRISHPEFGDRAHPLFTAVLDGHGADDCDGHGTEVAGVIGGTIHGVAKEADLYSVRVADCTGTATDAAIMAGIQQAMIHHQASNTPGVLNISLAQPGVSMASIALDAASQAGILVIGAAGNYGVDACKHFPGGRPKGMASEPDPEPIIVGVVNEKDTAVGNGVSWGNPIKYDSGECISLFAPGDGVETISNLSDTREVIDSGTSLSAGFVSGIAAIALQAYPTATPAQIKAAILQQATSGVVLGSSTTNPKLAYSIPLVHGISAPLRAIQLARPLPSQPVMSRGEVFEQSSFRFDAVSDGKRVILASDLSGKEQTTVDDVFTLECRDVDANGTDFGTPRRFTYDYSASNGNGGYGISCLYGHVFPAQPQNLSSLVARNQPGRCKLTLSDECGVFRSTTSLFLNMLP